MVVARSLKWQKRTMFAMRIICPVLTLIVIAQLSYRKSVNALLHPSKIVCRYGARIMSRLHASTIFDEGDSARLKKAKLRLAEAQGLLPFGASDMSVTDLKVHMLTL